MSNSRPVVAPRPIAAPSRWILPVAVVTIATAMAAGILITHNRSTNNPTSPQGDGIALAKVGAPAPNGTFTTADGTQETIASLRGHTTLVWLVAGGCASCAASIPTISHHLAQLQDKGVQVLTLGLYGAFDTGKPGVAQLTAFGRAAAGTDVNRPGWTWAIPTQSLSRAYDPTGSPDEYFLINPAGNIIYHDSAPVSTMPQLLAATGTTDATATPVTSPRVTATNTTTLP